ncbi:P-loop containing nucleoside triphosphate hydrolase protein [Coniella lustricola]|uniref:P-loop containing nucleoside triphosphate hydrolase protein n=1 Tax=Coniella lustricola TaxID=2025994 RepID=A0A2T3A949_9PEZI|nr:P-loop containing nucleoside triphosphate hydrolase protein [Coniella lustricola]
MEPQTVTIVVLGDEDCGKSTFLSRISRGHHTLDGTSTVTLLKDSDQPFVFEVAFGRRRYRLEFRDTSSPDNWRLLHPDLVLICYDISQRLSLMNLQRIWIKEVRTTFQTESFLPLAVLGLKRDLRSEDDPNGIIYPQEGCQVAQEIRADKYIECSAVTGELLSLAFEEICSMAVRTTTEEGAQSGGGCSVM